MTKQEAITAMFNGEKVTHMYFTPEEYVMIASDGSGRYQFEDGCIVNPALFWLDRKAEYFNDNWEIWKPKNL